MTNTTNQAADMLPSNEILVRLIVSQAKRLVEIQAWSPVFTESQNQTLAMVYRQLQNVEAAWLSEAARNQAHMRELAKPLPVKKVQA